MVWFGKHTSLLMTSILVGLTFLPSIATVAIAQTKSSPAPPSKNPDKKPSELTPSYPAVAPPPRVAPLPNQRQRQESTIPTDYRVNNLLGDFTGNLWVGSWRGLSHIDPNTGKILSRVSLPNTAIGALAQDKVGRLWVGNYEGLMRVDPRTSEITAQNLFLPSKP